MNEETLKLAEQLGFKKCQGGAMVIIHAMSEKAEGEIFNKLTEAFNAILELELNP